MTSVRINSGELRGAFDGKLHSFKGIPYAEPVGGAAAWLPPVARRPWSGVRDATDYGPVAMQFNSRGLILPGIRKQYLRSLGTDIPVVEGDDCLLLNVWTPTVDPGAKLPVMVWIHGGGFTSGAAFSLYEGSHFAGAGVVYVAIQYRVGPPGFLHGSGLFDGDTCADNRAFLDQLMSLRWVQDNIAAFGGDAGNVTIFGESAGAFSVFQLSASPMSKGLFHRCIAMGGMPFTAAPAADYHTLTREVLQDVGVAPGHANALAALDKPKLMQLQAGITKRIYGNKDPQRYGVLGRTRVGAMGAATGTAFLPRDAYSVLREGTPNNVDLMLGNCAADGQLFSLIFPFGRRLSARLFMNILRGLAPGGDLKPLLAHYKAHMAGHGTTRQYEQANNDLFYRVPTLAAAEAHAKAHPGRTYHYELEFESRIPGLRAMHGIDVAVLFGKNAPGWGMLPPGPAAEELATRMVKAWVNFAATGNPNSPGLPPWRPYSADSRATMVFDRETREENDLGGVFRRYWAGFDWQGIQ